MLQDMHGPVHKITSFPDSNPHGQIHVFSLPSAIVCMSGQDDLLGFVHHNACSPSASGDQVLEFQLMDIKSKKLLSRGPMCLSQGSKLEWFSVLSGAMLAALDSEGITTVYSPAAMGGQWCPVLDIKERNKARDWFWPIGIDEGHLNGVVCKIEKRYALPGPLDCRTILC